MISADCRSAQFAGIGVLARVGGGGSAHGKESNVLKTQLLLPHTERLARKVLARISLISEL